MLSDVADYPITSAERQALGLSSVPCCRQRKRLFVPSLRCGGRARRLGHVGVRKYATLSDENLFRGEIIILSVL